MSLFKNLLLNLLFVEIYNMKKILYTIIALFGTLLIPSCNNETPQQSIESDTVVNVDEVIQKARTILYQMYLPGEMTQIFKDAGLIFKSDVLNPTSKATNYATSSDAALNLGAYGVNLSYCRLFGEYQRSVEYLNTIKKLSEQLGIPNERFIYSFKEIEQNLSNEDSITKYINDLYITANTYLKEDERQVTAALIILGGWVESMYLATQMLDQDNKNVLAERIAVQKYSLNNVISLLNNYQNDMTVSKYILLLKVLKRTYDKIDIFYEQDDLTLDTINKLITANKLHLNIEYQTINDIKIIVAGIRNEIVQ